MTLYTTIDTIKRSWEILHVQGPARLIEKTRRFLSADYDAPMKHAIKTRAQSDRIPLFLDIGAATGEIVFGVAGQFQQSLCFEPSPSNFKHLQGRIGNRQDIKALNVALGNANAHKQFYLSQMSIANNRFSIAEDEKGESFTQVEVQMQRLDDVLSELRIKSPCIIKMDVEGSEFEVIKGARETLEKQAVMVISEFCPWVLNVNKTRPMEYIDYILGLGFKMSDLYGKPLSRERVARLVRKAITHKRITEDIVFSR